MTEQTSNSGSYEFIDLSSHAGVPTGQDTRRVIRRQAMSRAGAARRQRGFSSNRNRRQYPVLLDHLEERAEVESGSVQRNPSSQQQGLTAMTRVRMAVPASVPSSGYESMRIRYGFDLLDISALAAFHTGRITARSISREPHLLSDVLRCRQRSYFSFLPSRYGHSACLDDAAHCLAARVRQWMDTPSDPPDKSVLSLYAKSLTSLQSALGDPVACLQPEVLCATVILAIYEVSRAPMPWVWPSLIGKALG